MALSSKERTAKHRAIKAAEKFSKECLDGKTIATPEEFIDAKIYEAQQQIIGVVTEFEYELTNPFYEGLKDLDENDGHYDVADMFVLWKSILDELNEERELVLKQIKDNIKQLDDLKNQFDEIKEIPGVVLSEDLRKFMGE